jgi:hypothetical protein
MKWLQGRSLKTIAFSMNFASQQYNDTYRISLFKKLGDNGLSGCKPVVGKKSLKSGYILALLHLCSKVAEQLNYFDFFLSFLFNWLCDFNHYGATIHS